MKEFDESEAVAAMCKATGLPGSDALNDTACEVLDLIYDYYEESGSLDISDDSDDDIEAIRDYVSAQLRRHPAEVELTDEQLAAMVAAELDYEESVL